MILEWIQILKYFCFKLDCHFNFFKLDGHFLKQKNNVGADWSTTEYFFYMQKSGAARVPR